MRYRPNRVLVMMLALGNFFLRRPSNCQFWRFRLQCPGIPRPQGFLGVLKRTTEKPLAAGLALTRRWIFRGQFKLKNHTSTLLVIFILWSCLVRIICTSIPLGTTWPGIWTC